MSASNRGRAAEGLAVLDREPYSNLTTFRRDGSAVATPVWQAVADGRIYVFTEAASWKVKRLRRNPRVEVAPCDWKGGAIGTARWGGSAKVVEDPATVARAYSALDRKYGWQKWVVDLLSRLSGRYGGRAMLEIVLED